MKWEIISLVSEFIVASKAFICREKKNVWVEDILFQI